MYLGPPCYGYALNCHLVYLAIPGTCPLCMKKQNLFVLFICNRKKVKFKSVQINMKWVSYKLCSHLRNFKLSPRSQNAIQEKL